MAWWCSVLVWILIVGSMITMTHQSGRINDEFRINDESQCNTVNAIHDEELPNINNKANTANATNTTNVVLNTVSRDGSIDNITDEYGSIITAFYDDFCLSDDDITAQLLLPTATEPFSSYTPILTFHDSHVMDNTIVPNPNTSHIQLHQLNNVYSNVVGWILMLMILRHKSIKYTTREHVITSFNDFNVQGSQYSHYSTDKSFNITPYSILSFHKSYLTVNATMSNIPSNSLPLVTDANNAARTRSVDDEPSLYSIVIMQMIYLFISIQRILCISHTTTEMSPMIIHLFNIIIQPKYIQFTPQQLTSHATVNNDKNASLFCNDVMPLNDSFIPQCVDVTYYAALLMILRQQMINMWLCLMKYNYDLIQLLHSILKLLRPMIHLMIIPVHIYTFNDTIPPNCSHSIAYLTILHQMIYFTLPTINEPLNIISQRIQYYHTILLMMMRYYFILFWISIITGAINTNIDASNDESPPTNAIDVYQSLRSTAIHSVFDDDEVTPHELVNEITKNTNNAYDPVTTTTAPIPGNVNNADNNANIAAGAYIYIVLHLHLFVDEIYHQYSKPINITFTENENTATTACNAFIPNAQYHLKSHELLFQSEASCSVSFQSWIFLALYLFYFNIFDSWFAYQMTFMIQYDTSNINMWWCLQFIAYFMSSHALSILSILQCLPIASSILFILAATTHVCDTTIPPILDMTRGFANPMTITSHSYYYNHYSELPTSTINTWSWYYISCYFGYGCFTTYIYFNCITYNMIYAMCFIFIRDIFCIIWCYFNTIKSIIHTICITVCTLISIIRHIRYLLINSIYTMCLPTYLWINRCIIIINSILCIICNFVSIYTYISYFIYVIITWITWCYSNTNMCTIFTIYIATTYICFNFTIGWFIFYIIRCLFYIKWFISCSDTICAICTTVYIITTWIISTLLFMLPGGILILMFTPSAAILADSFYICTSYTLYGAILAGALLLLMSSEPGATLMVSIKSGLPGVYYLLTTYSLSSTSLHGVYYLTQYFWTIRCYSNGIIQQLYRLYTAVDISSYLLECHLMCPDERRVDS